MTEEEWLGCEDSMRMMLFLKAIGRERGLRLFLCTACRRIAELMGT